MLALPVAASEPHTGHRGLFCPLSSSHPLRNCVPIVHTRQLRLGAKQLPGSGREVAEPHPWGLMFPAVETTAGSALQVLGILLTFPVHVFMKQSTGFCFVWRHLVL